MIRLTLNLSASFRVSKNNRKSYRAGWYETCFSFNPKKDHLVKSRHAKSFPIPHTTGIPIGTKKKYSLGDTDWYSRIYIFLKETRFYNDKLKTRYDFDTRQNVQEWEFSSNPELEPTDHCQMYTVSYFLPFISIETTYKTEYGVQKDKESDEYFEKEFSKKDQ